MIKCDYCERTFKNSGGKATHQPYCPSNPNKIKRFRSKNAGCKKGSIPWNKGKTGLQKGWNKGIKGSTLGRCKNKTDELRRREKISKAAKSRNFGGYTKGSGRGKKGWYKGFFCDSSWELAYVIYCLDHQISIQRNEEKRQYTFKGKTKNYIPDFLVEGRLVEIKGYKSAEWIAKLEHNPDVIVMYEKDLTHVFEYVIDKYGKDYIKLYGE